MIPNERKGVEYDKKYEVRYLPAPERIHGGESAVTMQRDLPEAPPRRMSRPRRSVTGKPKR